MTNHGTLAGEALRTKVLGLLAADSWQGKRVLLLTPDLSRTCPCGIMLRLIAEAVAGDAKRLDVLVALGTHPPLSEAQMNTLFDLSAEDRRHRFRAIKFFNHRWRDPAALHRLGVIPADEINRLSEGRFACEVEVTINRLILDYDVLLVMGPVFPHEVVGFSGGNKYFFPGIAGPAIIDFFHWLGAVITSPRIIGNKYTPVRAVIDRAASLIPVERRCLALVTQGRGIADVFYGTPENAWSSAAELSAQLHIRRVAAPYHTVISCAPERYDELWTGAKCMYKLEPVVADGGELIIYAPHLACISATHGQLIAEIGYHVRDYFLAQWERFRSYPWGVLAHSTHLKGIGVYENGVERPRIRVTLATALPEALCRQICLGYRAPAAIDLAAYRDREAEGILVVPEAGEMLYKLQTPPAWQRL
ncbi:MAG: lactate racemase domain-containing protein [Planctomycetota bacterium]|nr:lactate racemase domain-containing protein [Planctomycetota bacterium]